jgi:hypothetical protein
MSKISNRLKKVLVSLVVPAAVALGYLTSLSQEIPPVTPCGNPPVKQHQCSTNLGGCDVHRVCAEQGTLGTWLQTWCCYHDAYGKCVQVPGGWECCPLDPPSWKAICVEKGRSANKTCFGGKCQ